MLTEIGMLTSPIGNKIKTHHITKQVFIFQDTLICCLLMFLFNCLICQVYLSLAQIPRHMDKTRLS